MAGQAGPPPGEKSLSSLIKNDFSTSGLGKTQLQKLSYAHEDPEIAKLILLHSLEAADEILKKGTLSQVEGNITYLERRLPQVTLIELSRELAFQFALEEKKKMALQSDLPYSFSYVGDLVLDRSPTKPSLAGILVLGIFAGLFLGFMIVFIRYGIAEK